MRFFLLLIVFFFNDTATTEIYTLSLHDALPICIRVVLPRFGVVLSGRGGLLARMIPLFRIGLGGPLGRGEQFMSWIALDRKSTRLNSSHANISYAVFCLKKKKTWEKHNIYYSIR